MTSSIVLNYNKELKTYSRELRKNMTKAEAALWQKIRIVLKLIKFNYYFSGMGFDLRKSDWMFTKKYDSHKIKTYLLPVTPRRIWKKYKFSEFI